MVCASARAIQNNRRWYSVPVRSRFPWRLAGVVLAVIGLVLAGRILPLASWLTAFQQWMQGQGPLGMLVFFALYVIVTLLLGPAWLLSIGAGLTWGLAIALPLVWVSATTAASAAFLAARSVARQRVEQAARGNATFAAIDKAIGRKGWKIVLLLRLSPLVPFNLSNYLYGLTAIRFGPYLVATAVGIVPLMVVFVALGAAGQSALGAGRARSAWEWAVYAAGILATIAATVTVTRIVKRELAQGHAGRTVSLK